MKIVIVSAMEKEVLYLKELMKKNNSLEIKKIHHYEFIIGKLYNHDVIITVSGMGKVRAGMLTSVIFDNFQNIDFFINNGISGGVSRYTKPGTCVIGCNYSFGDVDVTFDGVSKYGQLDYLPRTFTGDKHLIDLLKKENIEDVIFGDILTGDKFYTDFDETENIINKYFSDLKVCAFDMESTAFAMGAYMYHCPFIAIRAISDVIGVENQTDKYYENSIKSSEIANIVLLKLLNLISE